MKPKPRPFALNFTLLRLFPVRLLAVRLLAVRHFPILLCQILLAGGPGLAQTAAAPPTTAPPATAPATRTPPTRTPPTVKAVPSPAAPLAPAAPEPAASAKEKAKTKTEAKKEEPKDPTDSDIPVVTSHTVQVHGRELNYRATAGMMPLKNATGDVQARMFYIAYTLDGAKAADRPLLFSFNGGPGSSSVWLQLGAIGPRRIALQPDGRMPAPPFHLVDNESTWLDDADLVFIDPVGTGYSQAVKPEENSKYWGVQEDINSVAEFVRMYLTRYDRWGSPLFVVGESYGTFRAAGLAGALADRGIALNGVLLISSVLNFAVLNSGDLAPLAYLPTYTATAWYHKKLPSELEKQDLPAVLAAVEKWASTSYVQILEEGDRLSPEERQAAIDQLARFTGLSKQYIDDSDLRINDERLRKELLRDRKLTVGRYDSRFTGIDPNAAGESTGYDPSYAAVDAPFTMAFNNYVRTELGFKTDRNYIILGSVYPWNYGPRGMGYPETATRLRDAMAKNPYMQLFVARGYYDMATPFFGADYVLAHLGNPSFRDRITKGSYRAGHMVYVDTASREKLKSDVSAFFQKALAPDPASNVTTAP